MMENHSSASERFSVHRSISGQLKPHQLKGAQIILNRLLDDEPFVHPVRPEFSSNLPCTGLILADDMGTGKTLTALSVIWSIYHQRHCKSIVVAPASLIGNWNAEVQKWFGDPLGKLVLSVDGSRGGNVADETVRKFLTSPPSLRPLLIVTYEMFPTYSDAFQMSSNIEVLVCDEGHRLKNAVGTKCSLALSNCGAMRRLLLTGTPIQNNLDELYAVVQFVCPGYLGSLKEFQSLFVFHGIIQRLFVAHSEGKRRQTLVEDDDSSSEASNDQQLSQLREVIAPIFLRRTKEAVLESSLPPKTEYYLFCELSPVQWKHYLAVAEELLPAKRDCENRGANANGVSLKRRRCQETEMNACRAIHSINEATSTRYQEEGALSVRSGIALGTLSKLRQIANQCFPCGDCAEFNKNTGDVKDEACSSSKISFIESLINASLEIRPMERIVIVSNYITTLNEIQKMITSRDWKFLRLDGSIPPIKRQPIVRAFNSPNTTVRLLLLSAKAGGVGLNLTGASRMVLCEPDWNPATDAQAIGRIYRLGQLRPVFIYRLIAKETVDQSILTRQDKKNLLASSILSESNSHGAIDDPGIVCNDDTVEREEFVMESKDFVSMSVVEKLMFPGIRVDPPPGFRSCEITDGIKDCVLRRIFSDNKQSSGSITAWERGNVTPIVV